MSKIPFREKFGVFASVLSLLVLDAQAETLEATEAGKAFFVFINESRQLIQINVVSEDKSEKVVLPLPPGAIEGALFAEGQVELYTSSKNMVSGRLLFSRSLPTSMTEPEFMERGTQTFYFRVVGGKIILIKPTDLTTKERRWLKERTRRGW